MDNTQLLINQLRQRNQLQAEAARARDQQQTYANAMPENSQPLIGTPGYTTNINGHQAQMPGETQVNYGDIIGRGVSNYLSAKTGKEARDKEQAAKDLDQQFMMTTLNGDEVAQKLYAGASAGIPGMAQALTQHIAPKKEAMGAYLQYLQSENPDPDVAAQVAPKYGIDADMARNAAVAQRKYGQDKLDSAGQTKTDLLTQKGQQATDLQILKGEQKLEQTNAAAAAKPVRETEQSKLAARRENEDIQTINDVDTHVDKFKDLINMAETAKYLPFNMGLAPDAVNPKGVMLKQATNDLVLAATGGKLGAGISNADVSFLKEAQANFSRGNKDTAVAQLKAGLEKILSKRDAAYKRMGKAPPSSGANELPQSPYDYTSSKKRANGESLPSIDDILKEWNQ